MNGKNLNLVSEMDAKRIRKEIISKSMEFFEDEKTKTKTKTKTNTMTKTMETLICYYLWKIKTDPSIVTLDDATKKIRERKENQYATMLQDDLEANFRTYNYPVFEENTEAWEKFKSIANKYTEEELSAAVYKVDFIEAEDNESMYAKVPLEIGKLVDKLLDIKNDESVVEIGCSSYVIESQLRNPGAHMETYDEYDYTTLTLISCMSDVMGYSGIICRSSFEEEAKYDKAFVNNMLEPSEKSVLSDAQYDLKNEWEEFPSELSFDWNMCGTGILRTGEKGKAVAIMNAGQLTLNKYREVREFLCKGGYIEGVILLPDKMYSNTWINPYVIVFGTNNKTIRFLDARNECIMIRRKGKRINILNDELIDNIIRKYRTGESCIDVPLDVMKDCDYVLTPNRYMEVNNTNISLIKLGEMVYEIKRGITLSASDMDQLISDNPSEIRCILPSDIVSGVVTTDNYFHGELRKPGKNDAARGNVLISKTGNPFRIAVADRNYLVVGNTYILAIDRTKYSPEYVKCYLSSEDGQQEIMKYATGSMTPTISVSNLSNIEIPMYDEATQKELDKHAEEIVAGLNESYRQIRIYENEMNALFKRR